MLKTLYYQSTGYTSYRVNLEEGTVESTKTDIQFLRKSCIEVVDPDIWANNLDLRVEFGRDTNLDRDMLVVGEKYIRKTYKTSMFPKRLYLLKKLVKIDGRDKLILEYLEGEPLNGLTLDEDTCKFLEVEYVPEKLIVSDAIQEWKKVNKNVTWEGIDPGNLSTYPESTTEGCEGGIKYMIVKLSGFDAFPRWQSIKLPSGDVIDTDAFLLSLRVEVRNSVLSFNGFSRLNKEDCLEWSIITDIPGTQRTSEDHIVDESGNIYLLLALGEKGVSSVGLDGRDINSLIRVSYDGAFTNSKDDRVIATSKLNQIPRHHTIFEVRGGRAWRSVVKSTHRYTQSI